MALLPRAVRAPERMDTPDVAPRHLEGALDHIVAVNRWLGARRALLRHLPWALPVRDAALTQPARVLDIGTGSGDLLAAVVDWARERERPIQPIGLDLHPTTLAVARRRTADPIRLVRGDGLRLPFPDGSFDLVHLGMVLHHMDGDRLPGLLREAARAARGGRILVSELERNVANYLGARLLAATVWRFNPVTRHDGPLSVRRAFTPTELLELAGDAGLRCATVHRHPFFRLVLRAEA